VVVVVPVVVTVAVVVLVVVVVPVVVTVVGVVTVVVLVVVTVVVPVVGTVRVVVKVVGIVTVVVLVVPLVNVLVVVVVLKIVVILVKDVGLADVVTVASSTPAFCLRMTLPPSGSPTASGPEDATSVGMFNIRLIFWPGCMVIGVDRVITPPGVYTLSIVTGVEPSLATKA
jgi:hypothetical protein